jgi:hypothetical protein
MAIEAELGWFGAPRSMGSRFAKPSRVSIRIFLMSSQWLGKAKIEMDLRTEVTYD